MSDTNNKNSCSQKTCRSGNFGHPYPNTGVEDRNSDFSGRPVLYTGVLWIGVLRRFLIPRPVVDTRPCCPCKAREKLEANDGALTTPINTSSGPYIQPSVHAHDKPQEIRGQDQVKRQDKQESKHSPLASLVYQIQEASTVLKDEARQFSEDLSELVKNSKATTGEMLYTLREDEAVAERYGAIAITSLLGYMAGMRRSAAVRLVYAATGAVATATLCYPEEARHFNDIALAFFREGVLLSVRLLRFGPAKTIVTKDTIEQETLTSSNNKQVTPKSYSKQSQETKTTSTTNIDSVPSQVQSFGRFEHKEKQNHLCPTIERSTLQQHLPFLEQQERPPRAPSQFPVREGILSRECQRDTNSLVPYSPALAGPPETEPENFQNSITCPAKTIVTKDTIEQETPTSSNNKQVTPKSYSKQSQETKTTSTTNIDSVTSQVQSFGRFEPKEKQNHLCPTIERSTLQQHLPFLEQQEIPPRAPSQFPVREGILSRECQRDTNRLVPYSPALAVPPETEPENFQNSNTCNTYQNVPDTTPDEYLGNTSKENADFRPNSLHDSHSSLKAKICQTEHERNQLGTNLTDTNDVIAAIEPVKEIGIESSNNEKCYKSQNYPLNKKLSRYYQEKGNNMFTSLEAGGDDCYRASN